MSHSDSEWPHYLAGTREEIHALGAIAAIFNRLEHKFLGLFLVYLGFNETMMFLFARLRDNTARMDLLKYAVEEKGETPEIKDAIHHFCKGLGICADNRNILMHSGLSVVSEDGSISHIIFRKGSKRNAIDWSHYPMDLVALRRVADETYQMSRYGNALLDHVVINYHSEARPEMKGKGAEHPLPGKPPLPIPLTPQSHQAAITFPSPPESSRE
jgi:hypothetical protein